MNPEFINPAGVKPRNSDSGRFRRRPDSGRSAVAGILVAATPHLTARVIGPGPRQTANGRRPEEPDR